MKVVVNKIVQQIISNNYVDKSQEKILIYGINLTIELMINFICLIFVTLITQEGLFLVLFIISFSILRFYTGGVHFNKFIWCLLFSNAIVLFITYNRHMLKYIPRCPSIVVMLIIIYVLSPQSSSKRILSDGEKRIFSRRRNITLFIFVIIICISEKFIISIALEWALLVNAISLILGFIKNVLLICNCNKHNGR